MNKKILLLFFAILLAFTFGGCKVIAKKNIEGEHNMTQKKILVAYYSYSGNTETIAKKIQAKTQADIFKIETLKPYPQNYNAVVEQAKQEKASDFKPELKTKDANIENYDVIFLGTPVWWYTMSPALKSFISSNSFKGKIIVPFCTHGGGGASSTFDDMKKLIPDAEFKKGYVTYDNGGNGADKEIDIWLDEIGL